MSDKALLVMDMPNNCEECPFCDDSDYTCGAFRMIRAKYTYVVPENGVADWCPLKPMPKKKICEYFSIGRQIRTWREVWNGCIDKILEGCKGETN